MVFVHARNATVKTANSLKDMAVSKGDSELFAPEQSPSLGQAEKQVIKDIKIKFLLYNYKLGS